MRSSVRATGRNRSDKARGMAFRKIIDRVLGRPGAFDVDAVTSVLRGRSQPKQTEIFRGFNSPPVDATTVAKAPPPAANDNSATKEKRGTKTKRKRTDIPAQDRAANNGVPASQIKKIEIRTSEVPNDTLYVELEKQFSWVFGGALGLSTDPVSAGAAAQIRSLRGTSNLMPWAIMMGDSACLDSNNNPISGANCTVKLGSGASAIGGWYGALDLDGAGGGSTEYQSRII